MVFDRLKPLAEVGTVISCPRMTLLAGDHEPPIITGEGEITVLTTTSFGYVLRGTPEDVGHALRSLRRIDADSYDVRLRERLIVTTADGLSVQCGWTTPKVHGPAEDGSWICKRQVQSLSFTGPGSFEPGTKVAYLLPPQHRARILLRRFFPPQVGAQMPEVRLTVLGSEVVLTLDDEADLLLARAPATEALPLTFTENWLGEPFRVLFGQPIEPRFVARQADAWSMAWIRPSPGWSRDSDGCALWQEEDGLVDAKRFWGAYRRMLAYVASARGEGGVRNFDANDVTRLYDELVRAAHVSRWVWALTYASAVEAMVKLLGLEGQPRTDMDAAALAKLTEAVEGFKSHVDCWEGDPSLKEPAKRSASRLLRISAAQGLRQLKQEGHVTGPQLDAWNRVRNRVMHGSLLSPYSTAEEDELLLNLAHLFHALTWLHVAGMDPGPKPSAIP